MKQAHKEFYTHLDTPELLAQRNFVLEMGFDYPNDVKKQNASREHYTFITKVLSDRGLPNERAIELYKKTMEKR